MAAFERIKVSKRIKFLLIFLTIILIVMMFPKGESLESDVVVNSIWIQEDLIASQPFEILKDPVQYEREKAAAANSVSPIFVLKNETINEVKDSISSYNTYLVNLLDSEIFLDSENNASKTFLSESSYKTFKNIRNLENNLSSTSNVKLSTIFRSFDDIIDRIYRRGFLNLQYDEIEKDSISVREGKYERLSSKFNYYDPVSVTTFIETRLQRRFSNPNTLSAVKEYLTNFIKPNLVYDEKLTNDAKALAMSKVSRNKGIVNENERIVAKHDRITPEIKDKIESYRIAKGTDTSFLGRFLQYLGKFLHIVAVFTLFFIYIYLFRKKIYNDNYKILLISILLLLISFIAFIVSQLAVSGPVELLILVPVISMLLTIIFDSRVGFYATVICALIVGALRGNDYVIAVMNIVAGGLAAYTVRDIKNRNQIFRSFLFILLGYVVSIIAFALERFDSAEQILIHTAYAATNAVLSPALTFGLIIFFEKIFKITTELTLLELSDFNTPLLRDLARNAPGTFNHSMTIGSMVESAAEAIGANPILARVGAYYHDIGKLANPDGFVENQLNTANIHESLEPSKSAKMIIDHVNRGIEMAKKYKLPQEIIDFIPMHHGTMVVTFFYEKAKEKFGEDKVKKDDYRYPGPKPNSKEAALLMLADACESAVRAMSEPDQKKVENMINNLVKQRVDDGQLNDSPLTFKDIEKIKAEFLKILVGQHHKRIRYPKQEEMESSSTEEEKK